MVLSHWGSSLKIEKFQRTFRRKIQSTAPLFKCSLPFQHVQLDLCMREQTMALRGRFHIKASSFRFRNHGIIDPTPINDRSTEIKVSQLPPARLWIMQAELCNCFNIVTENKPKTVNSTVARRRDGEMVSGSSLFWTFDTVLFFTSVPFTNAWLHKPFLMSIFFFSLTHFFCLLSYLVLFFFFGQFLPFFDFFLIFSCFLWRSSQKRKPISMNGLLWFTVFLSSHCFSIKMCETTALKCASGAFQRMIDSCCKCDNLHVHFLFRQLLL